VPRTLPALTRAVKLQRKASKVGFDWNDARQVLAKIREETGEVEAELSRPGMDATPALAEEIGDLLFVVANLSRHAGVDPEQALRGANAKFERRFGHIERSLASRGVDPASATLDEMEALWNEAKALEKAGARSR
jgi:MazG family protein